MGDLLSAKLRISYALATKVGKALDHMEKIPSRTDGLDTKPRKG